ncbi:MAG TPA: hypothetical protein VFZ76_00650, partial [Anaerolineales bacterium]
ETTPDRLVRISAATEQRFPAGVDPSGPANVSSVAVTTDMSEGFESSWPAAGWDIADVSSSDGGEYLFGKRDCHPHTGAYGGWSVGGGAQGSALSCSGNYPNNASSWAVYGPFDLTGATSASLTFHVWGRSEYAPDCSIDYLYVGSSINGSSFSGGTRYCGDGTSGTAGNGYHEENLDLSSRLGQNQVWVGLVFVSNDSTTHEGFTLDDLALTVSGAVATATPPESATNTPTATLPVPTPTGTTVPSGDSDNFLPVVLRDYPSGPAPTPTQTATSGPPAPTATPSPTATTPSIVPKDGDWSGTNDQGRSLSFSVASNGTSIPKFTLQVGWNGACGGVSYTESYFYDIGINNLSFSKTSGSNKITGSFSGAATASGTYDAVLETYYPYYCKVTRSGTWTATTP